MAESAVGLHVAVVVHEVGVVLGAVVVRQLQHGVEEFLDEGRRLLALGIRCLLLARVSLLPLTAPIACTLTCWLSWDDRRKAGRN